MPDSLRLGATLLSLLFVAGGANAAGPPAKQPTDLFGLTKVWELHLVVSAADWNKMPPTRGGFPGMGGPAAAKPIPEGRIVRGNFGFDFEQVKADLVIGGVTFKNVALRFKGSGTYAMSQRLLKRPFKIDLDKFVAGRSFLGVSKLVLNNNVMDPTAAREALAYGVYRAAGIPTPRTAYAAVRLTVPGKYDKELLGVYTLAEAVDKAFLKKHYGSDKGLLLKPERVGAMDHLGTEWDEYDARYRPKTKASEAARKKLIALTRLLQYGDDERFAKEIAGYVDIDRFLRYLAATVLLSSTDSFVGLAHNYYLYLDPKTDKFSVIPWDADLTFAGLALGNPGDLIDLSIRQPHMGRNALVDRLLSDEKHFATYKGHLRALLKSGFTEAGLARDLDAITRAIGLTRDREKKAAAARKEPAATMGPWFPKSPELMPFVKKRIASVQAQLAGKSAGKKMSSWTMTGPSPLARAVLKAADKDEDKHLSRDEVAAGLKAIFANLDPSKGELQEKGLTAALQKIVPRPPAPWPGFGQPAKPKEKDKKPAPPAPHTSAIDLARSMVERGGTGGKVVEKRLLAAADRLFTKHDLNKDGKLNERELAAALQELMPTPAFMMPAVERPAPAKPPERKETKK